jgi:NAD(P) transhydrogenase subunit alpha
VHGVTIAGPLNLASSIPYHASQMYAKNVVTFLKNITSKENALKIDTADEITVGTLMCQDGQVVHPRLRELLGMPALAPAAVPAKAAG